MLQILIAGAIGGAARGLIGYSKYYRSYKNMKFDIKYFGMTVGIATLVGLGAAWVLKSSGVTYEGLSINPAVAVIVGYAGGDAIENIYKIILKKPQLKAPSKKKKK